MCIKSLGFPNEQHGGDVYFCEPTPGLGIAVWYEPRSAFHKEPHYFVRPFSFDGGTTLERAWLDSLFIPAGLPHGTYAPPDKDLLAVSAIVHDLTKRYLGVQAYEQRFATAA
jgi:hypothetical protein